MVIKKITTYALECPVYFLSEQRTELYKRYCSGVAQVKNALGAKNDFIERTLPTGRQARFGLERRGA